MIWFGLVLWHIKHCRSFNAKLSLYIYIYIYTKYIWFGLFWFYGISNIVGYIISNPLCAYILNICGFVGWFYGISTIAGYLMPNHVLHKIKYIWFGLIGFYGISTIVGYLISNPVYTCILKMYDLIWLSVIADQPLLLI